MLKHAVPAVALMVGVAALAAAPAQAAGDAAAGKKAYMTNCIACHNQDPSKAGPIGPPVAGASEELIRLRVMHGNAQFGKSYPDGYTPKRDTKIMPPQPHLEDKVPDLAAFLNQ